RTVVVCSVLLFVGGDVAKVRLHRGDVRLVLGVGELRNRNRGKNADDDDYDQKLNEGKTLFVADHKMGSGRKRLNYRDSAPLWRRESKHNRQAVANRCVARLGAISSPNWLE